MAGHLIRVGNIRVDQATIDSVCKLGAEYCAQELGRMGLPRRVAEELAGDFWVAVSEAPERFIRPGGHVEMHVSPQYTGKPVRILYRTGIDPGARIESWDELSMEYRKFRDGGAQVSRAAVAAVRSGERRKRLLLIV